MIEVKDNKAIVKLNGVITPEMADEFDSIFTMLSYEDYDEIEEVQIRINSPGGSVFALFSMLDTINTCQKKVTMINTGVCASAAALLFLHTNIENRFCYNYSTVMIHDVTASDKKAKEVFNNSIHTILSNNFKDSEKLTKMMKEETYFDSEELISNNLIYRSNIINSSINKPVYNNIEELYEICNKIDIDKMAQENIKNEEVIGNTETETLTEVIENTDIEVVEETTETVETEVVEETPESEISETPENTIEEVISETSEVQNLMIDITNLKSEIDTLKNELKTYKDKEDLAKKLEVLKVSNVSPDSYDVWTKFSLEEIKNLTKTIVKSPSLTKGIEVSNKSFDKLSKEEKLELFESDEAAYMELFRASNKK